MGFPPNTTALDAAVDLTKIHGELVTLGFDTIIRYVAPSDNSWKLIREAEAKSMQAHNLKLALVYEATAQDALRGSAAGAAAGRRAAQVAASVGLPPNNGSVLFASTDFDVVESEYSAVENYVSAFGEATPGYGTGLYGNGAITNYLFEKHIIHVRWITQSMGFQGTRESLAAGNYDIVQRLPAKIAGIDTDPDSLRLAGSDIGARVPWEVQKAPVADKSASGILSTIAGWFK